MAFGPSCWAYLGLKTPSGAFSEVCPKWHICLYSVFYGAEFQFTISNTWKFILFMFWNWYSIPIGSRVGGVKSWTCEKFENFFTWEKSTRSTLVPNFSVQFVFLHLRNVHGFICWKFQPCHNKFTENSFEIFNFLCFLRSKKHPKLPRP